MKEIWWLAADAEAVLERHGLLTVAACMEVASRGRTLSTDRQSAAVVLEVETPLLLKWRRPRPGRRWRTAYRASRERKEARTVLRARVLGIDAPAPIAVAERRGRTELVGSVLIRPFLPRHERADVVLQGDEGGPASGVLARELGRWHALGFRHGDCYPKNVLLDEEWTTALPIGCPRGQVRAPGTKPDRRRLKDLAQWAAGLLALRPDEDPFLFLRAYAEAAGLPGPEWLSGVVRPLFAKIQERKQKRLATLPRREPHGPPPPVPLSPDADPVATQRRRLDDLVRRRTREEA